MASELNKFVYGAQDDMQLRQQLVDVAETFGCVDGFQEWIAFAKDSSNIQAIKEAVKKYGVPPKNRPSERKLLKWKNYCDWQPAYRFFYYAKLAQDFPALNPQNKENCYSIEGYLLGLEQERVAANKIYAIKNDKEKYAIEMEVINEKIKDFNSLFSTMACTDYFNEQDTLKKQLSEFQAKEQSSASLEEAFKKSSGTSGGGTKIALYVFGGAAALIGIMFLASRKKAA